MTPGSVREVRKPGDAATPEVAVILLNWNGWRDTLECLESVFRMSYPAFTVLVCDNASTDGSLDQIRAWAGGVLAAPISNAALEALVVPPVPKPVKCITIDPQGPAAPVAPDARLVLLSTGANLGFAGGNNVGLRYALSRPEIEYFWLLNNDTVVEPNALDSLVVGMHNDPAIGLCGSVHRDYFSPDSVLTLGGRRYNRWSGRSAPILPDDVTGRQERPVPLDYVEGASMLVRRSFLETIGLMSEDYFLYFEEMDWAMRAKGRFRLGYSPQSVVYHKEGGTIGSHKDRNRRSTLTDFFQARNRLVFTRRFFPWLLPGMVVSIAATAAHRLLRGRRQNAGAVIKGMFAGRKARRGEVA